MSDQNTTTADTQPEDFPTRQPPGLWVLFITEMWERFSYYGMRALFVLFLVASIDNFLPADLGFENDDARNAAVIEMLATQTGVAADQITPESVLKGDLALDGADKAALLATLEARFEVTFPDDPAALDGAETVEDLAVIAADLGQGDENFNPGFGWDNENAYLLYGTYTFMVYLTSIFGGIVADRFLGTHRSMLLGGWVIALGHLTLAAMAFFPHELGTVVTQSHGYPALLCFLLGCSFIIIGTGFFKPCVSVMVGQLYGQNDPRRDSGFTIFYMGINLGAFFSPLIAGYLGEKIGWHYGFGSAAVGMLLGLFFYQMARGRYLGTIGAPPGNALTGKEKGLVFGAFSLILAVPLLPLLGFVTNTLSGVVGGWNSFTTWVGYQTRGILGVFGYDPTAGLGEKVIATVAEQADVAKEQISGGSLLADLPLEPTPLLEALRTAADGPVPTDPVALDGITTVSQLTDFVTPFAGVGSATLYGMAALIALLIVGGALWFLGGQPKKDRGPLAVIIILAFLGNICFWTAFEQAGSSMTTFAADQTDLTIWGLIEGGIPASFYQSVNPFTILLFAPVFSWLWMYLERKRKDPSTPMKFAIGLWLLGLAFLAMVAGAWQAKDGGLAGPHWLLITYVVYTWGELCLSPVGLSMVTKLAPKHLQSLMMGLWFFTFALSNLCAGLVARFSVKFLPQDGAPAEMTFLGIEGLAGFYLMLVIVPLAAGCVIFAISPIIKRMMRGIH